MADAGPYVEVFVLQKFDADPSHGMLVFSDRLQFELDTGTVEKKNYV